VPRTFYEYDDDGRLVSSYSEPEWDEDSVTELQALEYVVRNTGPNGEWLPEATSDGADPNDYSSGFGYRPTGPFTNWAEKMRLDALEAWKKEAGPKANANGLYFGVERYEFEVTSPD
jgi:hypothetical protein